MIWPTLCVDNFFNEPDKVVEFANSCKFSKEGISNYPGTRTEPLHLIDPGFFEWSCKKILSLLYPNEILKGNISWRASQHFQKVPNNLKADGWVHRDPNEFTAIIYLSKYKNCGTSIYTPKNIYGNIKGTETKHEFFKNGLNKDIAIKEKNNNNEQFEESISFDSVYNRLILFDGQQYHAAQPFLEKNSLEERLTLITFFEIVNSNDVDILKLPIPQSRRI